MSYSDISLAAAFYLADARGVAIAATNTSLPSAVTSAFDALTSSGELDAIRKRWVGDLATISASNQLVVNGVAQQYADAQAAQAAADAAAAGESQEGEGEGEE